MTVEEAIEILPCIGKPEHIYSLQECEAIQISIEALVKQIPKKPKIETEQKSYMIKPRINYYCPNCGSDVEYLSEDMSCSDIYKYCPCCGQRIDGGGTDGE